MNKMLMYHSIGKEEIDETGAKLYTVSLERFGEQIEYLVESGTVPCGDSPFLSFDDGNISNYKYAYPILKDYGLKAYFFILASRIGKHGYMSWSEIEDLEKEGMIIGSHGMTHRILVGLDDKELDFELRESKKILEDKLKHAIEYFSVPRGFYNKKIINIAKDCGYKGVFTSDPKDNNGYRIGRLAVMANWDLNYFKSALNDKIPFKDKTISFVKSSVRKVVGIRNYDRIRERIVKK